MIEGCTLMLFRSLVVRLPGWVKGLPASTIETDTVIRTTSGDFLAVMLNTDAQQITQAAFSA